MSNVGQIAQVVQSNIIGTKEQLADIAKSHLSNQIKSFGMEGDCASKAVGIKDWIALLDSWLSAFPDMRYQDLQIYKNSDNLYMCQWDVIGTNSKNLGSLKPSHKKFAFQGFSAIRIDENGRISAYDFEVYLNNAFKNLYNLQDTALIKQKLRLYDFLCTLGGPETIITQEEVMCLSYYLFGLDANQIAEHTSIPIHEIHMRIENSMSKLNCRSTKQLDDLSRSQGLHEVFKHLFEMHTKRNKLL